MTQTIQGPLGHTNTEPIPSHPHFTLASMTTIGLVGTLIALSIAIASLMITAGRNSVDDTLVAQKVDAALAEATPPMTPDRTTDPSRVASSPPSYPRRSSPLRTCRLRSTWRSAPQMPPPIGRTDPAIVDVGFEVVENVSTVDLVKGTQFETWGYRVVDGPDGVSGTPGPVIRARVGDVLRLTVTNPAGNTMPHNIDFHAVTGQGGGAAALTVKPGESATIEARLLYPGFFLYHCAAGDVPAHISHGMYGGVLVQPENRLPEVDHEWYMVQSEYYLTDDGGVAQLDRQAVTDENPTLVVFNGAVGALTGDNALQMNVGERSRIFLANAGLNLTSNFHPIGSHWDRVWEDGALLNPALRGVQTTLVPAGGATVVDIVGQVPQTVLLVDHALARTFDKGALGHIVISGDETRRSSRRSSRATSPRVPRSPRRPRRRPPRRPRRAATRTTSTFSRVPARSRTSTRRTSSPTARTPRTTRSTSSR